MGYDQEKIGEFIKMLRIEQKMTQTEFAEKLNTSQSAVARMEAGGQNFTTKELKKISEVLGHTLVTLNNEQRDDFIVEGGTPLSGSITTNTSKNGALGLICAALLNKGTTVLQGIPRIEEINRIVEIFESIGVQIQWTAEHTLTIKSPRRFQLENLDVKAAGRIRSVLMMIGALVHVQSDFTLPHAGGCKMGERTISAHRFALESFGVSIVSKKHKYEISGKQLSPAEFVMYEASDTGTINALLCAARIPGKSTIHFAQQNYMVQDVMIFLRKLGVTIEHRDAKTLVVHGKKNIKVDIEHWNSEDPIESMMFISAGIVTNSELTITRCPLDFLRLEILRLEKMGMQYNMSKEYLSHNKHTKLVDITVFPSKLIAPADKLHPLPYPGINADNLPFFVPIATQAAGTTLVHDWMWENRAIYFAELNRLGADVRIADPHRVYIEGPTKLSSAEIVCPPALRPSIMILVAMLAAKGTSKLRNVYAINRGYEKIVERFCSIGARIKKVDSF